MADSDARSPADAAALPSIPAKRYFTIGEVGELCGVKPHVLRYWEQEFTQLRPVKRRGNRRYYQHHEVLLVRRIRELLYDEGFTIQGARNRLDTIGGAAALRKAVQETRSDAAAPGDGSQEGQVAPPGFVGGGAQLDAIRGELLAIRSLLQP